VPSFPRLGKTDGGSDLFKGLPPAPSSVLNPSLNPSSKPSLNPSSKPSLNPSSKPSLNPSSKPSLNPSSLPASNLAAPGLSSGSGLAAPSLNLSGKEGGSGLAAPGFDPSLSFSMEGAKEVVVPLLTDLQSAKDFLSNAPNSSLFDQSTQKVGRGFLPTSDPSNYPGYRSLYDLGIPTPKLDPLSILNSKIEKESLTRQLNDYLKTNASSLGSPMSVGELGIEPTLANLRTLAQQLNLNGLAQSGSGLANSGSLGTSADILLNGATDLFGSQGGAELPIVGGTVPVTVVNDNLPLSLASPNFDGIKSLASPNFKDMTFKDMTFKDMTFKDMPFKDMPSLASPNFSSLNLDSLLGANNSAPNLGLAKAPGAGMGGLAKFMPYIGAAFTAFSLISGILSGIRNARKQREERLRDEYKARESFARNNDNFYLKRESGAYDTKNLADYEKRFSTGDLSVAGRYEKGGIVKDLNSAVSYEQKSFQEQAANLLQKEGSKGRLIVASLGERVLTEDENKWYEQAKRTGALSLIESNSANFKSGGIIGSESKLSSLSSLSARNSSSSKSLTLNAPTTINIHGALDYDSFKRSRSEIEAEQAAAQRTLNRRVLGS